MEDIRMQTDAVGEHPLAGGFRRASAGPEPLALARLRALLLEVANGGSARLREALEGFRSWRSLATLCGSEWTAGLRRSSAAARRLLQNRLRALGTAPITIASAERLPVGSCVHVRGTIRPMLPTGSKGSPKSHIWSHSAMSTHNVRATVEEGHDFFLTDEEGRTACVMVARGHLVNAEQLISGDRVSVFGFTDLVAAAAPHAASIDRAAFAPALRAGDDLPLLIRRLDGAQER
jgi:hypothetical protein